MSKNEYSEAFSRRFSNFVATAETPQDYSLENPIARTLTVVWDGDRGRVLGDATANPRPAKSIPASSCSFSVKSGDSIKLTAAAGEGYHFVKWVGGPVDGDTSKTVNITMKDDCTVEAVFAADEPTPGNGDPEDPATGDPEDPLPNGDTPSEGIIIKLKPFLKKWWWVILIVAYIAYNEWKGGKK